MNVPPVLPFARLGLIDDLTPRGGALNMAIDETLLGGLGDDPLLRIYRWVRPAVSMGYFDPVEPVADRWPGYELVRRWTGGGIVEHGSDLTFSLLVPRALPLATLPAAESYRFIHLAVATALGLVGGPMPTLQDAALKPAAVSSRACFENPVTHDLLATGRKIGGGAQRRTRRGLLHQASIQSGDGSQPPWVVTLAQTLPDVLGLVVGKRCLASTELSAAGSLAAAKYGTLAWLQRF